MPDGGGDARRHDPAAGPCPGDPPVPRPVLCPRAEAGGAAAVLGAAFITEGAIPFAAADPLRVIPALVAGSATAGALALTLGVTLKVPHGGLFVLPIPNAVTNLPGALLALAAGTLVTALAAGFLKKRAA